jgi:hypothetical protein
MRLTNAPTNALQRTTNAHADAHTNAPTNDANALCTRPPIPPVAFVRPRARLQAPSLRLAHRHGCAIAPLASVRSGHPIDDQHHGLQKAGIDLITGPCAFITAICGLSTRQQRVGLSASAPVEYQARNGGSASPCASQQSGKPVCPPHNPLRHNETQRRHHLFDDHKGFYARGLPHSQSFLGSNGAHQALALCEKRQRYACFRPSRPGGVPVGGKPSSLRLFDVLPQIRGPVSQNLDRPVLKKLVGL